MGQCPQAEDVEVEAGDNQIPDKVACGQSLDHGAGSSVSPEALLPVHLPALIVVPDDPDSDGIDEAALDHGHDLSIPVKLLLAGELGVVPRGKKR